MPTPRPTLAAPPESPSYTLWLQEGSVDYSSHRDAGLEEDRDLKQNSVKQKKKTCCLS